MTFILLTHRRKKKFAVIYLSPSDFFNRDIFISKLNTLDRSYRYSILFRVCFALHPSYKMLGNQIGLNYEECQDSDSLHQYLHNNLFLRLESSITNYNFSADDVITIQLLAFKVDYSNTVLKDVKLDFSLNNLAQNKDLINVSKTKVDLVFNKILPPTMDLTMYGSRLDVTSDNGKIKSVSFNNEWIDLPSLIVENNIKEKNIVLTDDTQIFYHNNKYLV